MRSSDEILIALSCLAYTEDYVDFDLCQASPGHPNESPVVTTVVQRGEANAPGVRCRSPTAAE